jgi:hypothetical protein
VILEAARPAPEQKAALLQANAPPRTLSPIYSRA